MYVIDCSAKRLMGACADAKTEVIGFWTPEYLKHKIQKLNLLRDKESLIRITPKF